ncbi:MAG: DNA topoisomerase 4 subunit A [Lachnospiraceae bacterium]|nr:DNA topoisomerase 4 subunit A [Lachnospiraceae bacterium]MDD6168692.1 DNA topoisomerase 4 subunit A [Lachnospiraceae bacterium]MDY4838049.1 DNA topoisomerase (ATP-hydrolyzing) [Lachnospiraceae bacterium]
MQTEDRLIHTEYSEIMQKSYIDYAMSVIISRALPDVRDGLKPVQRRTLYDMYELGIRYDKPYRKCARIVGDTMGKYHPHGDSSIYEALVVLAQDFKKGMALVDGHGNFGSIEGDGAAAMRYTEARLKKVTQDVYLSDLDKDVVDFVPNFDETEKEPEVLPVKVPNILINGAEGIAVGMATNIPPHNFGEVIDGVIAYMKNPDINTEQMMEYIKGPDFPTGGIVTNKDELLSIYSTGVGKIKIRGKVEVEKAKGGRERLVITEIPYTMIGLNIGKFLNDVYSLVESKKTTDIVDISNQSSKEGIRIVIEVKKGADIENLKNMLYKKTKLEDTFGVNMLAVADGRPETLGIVPLIRHHVNFQYELATRKYKTLLAKELDKKEIQEGLIGACDVIDLIIEILRGSTNIKDARACLTMGDVTNIHFKSKESENMAKELHFTERQATAILEMRLYKLIGLELEALKKEHEETLKNIAQYEDILSNRATMAKVIIKELERYKKEYGVARRTKIENAAEVVFEEKKIEEMDVVVLMDRFGYAKTIDVSTYERNKEAADTENRYLIFCKNTDKICLFTNKGQMHLVKVLDLPYGKFRDKGTPIDNVSNYNSSEEDLIYITSMEHIRNQKVLFGTRNAMIKLVDGAEFDVAKRTTAATKLSEEDELIFVQVMEETDHIVMQSKKDMFLRIEGNTVPEKKKGAIGVRGMRLAVGDALEAIYLLKEGESVSVTVKDKEVALNRLHVANRDTKGVKR